MPESFLVTGVLTDGQNLRLDVPIPLEGLVRVTLEAMEPEEPTTSAESPRWLYLMYQIWEAQRQRGCVRHTFEEISSEIFAERECWGD